MNKKVIVTLKDELNEKFISRELDISVLHRNGAVCWELETRPAEQIALIQNWIDERGNDQHDTLLTFHALQIVEAK